MATLDQQYDSSKFFLYSVNILLQVINELPINDDVELAEIQEAQLASSVLIETKKEVLSDGWNFNTDKDYSFAPNIDGFINIPSNVLDISSSDGDLVMRDWRLYSKSNQSAIFDEPQVLDVIWDVDFNSLTHPLRNFITIRAARKFQARQVMDTSVYGYTADDEEAAFVIAKRSEGFTGRYNMLKATYGLNNSVIG